MRVTSTCSESGSNESEIVEVPRLEFFEKISNVQVPRPTGLVDEKFLDDGRGIDTVLHLGSCNLSSGIKAGHGPGKRAPSSNTGLRSIGMGRIAAADSWSRYSDRL